MELIINAQARRLDAVRDGGTVAELVAALEMQADRIALECNGEIVPRSEWPATRVHEGDRLEIVHFVGGGKA